MLRLLEKRRKQKKTPTKKVVAKKVVRNSATKKATRTLEDICLAKPDYEIILMNDGSKSCRKKCRKPKPLRSSSKSRKCIAGTKVLGPRVSSRRSANRGPRTLEQTCAAKKDYEIVLMDDGKPSCRKKCLDPNKPVRSSSQGRKCIKGVVRPPDKTRTKKANKDSDEAEYDEDDENNLDDDDDEDDEDSGSDDEYYDADFVVNDEDFDERTEQELDNIIKNRFKKPKIASGADCLQAVSVKQMKDEIKKRETDEFEKGYDAVEEEAFAKRRNKSHNSPSPKSPSQGKSPSQRKAPSQRKSPSPKSPSQRKSPSQVALMLAERKRLRDEKYKNKTIAPTKITAADVSEMGKI